MSKLNDLHEKIMMISQQPFFGRAIAIAIAAVVGFGGVVAVSGNAAAQTTTIEIRDNPANNTNRVDGNLRKQSS